MSEAAERQDRPQLRHRRDLGRQKGPAGGDLAGFGLVLRRHAAHRIGDPRPSERQAVIGAGAVISLGQAEFTQGRVQQFAGMIAGKRPPGAVGAFETGRQADDQQLGPAVAKGRNRRVEPLRAGRALRLAKGGQTRTERAVARRQRRVGQRGLG